MNENETTSASIEDLSAINPEYLAELDALCIEVEKHREFLNLVPLDKDGEQYIRQRYPIAALYARADLQDIAQSDFETHLTESEIQSVSDEFYSEYPDEIHIALAEAIERVINERSVSDETTL